MVVVTTTDAEPGLRERKRLATRRSIQLAVVNLVAEGGLDGVTVDEISRVADISPRTFFNYFASKEEAMLGDAPDLPSAAAIGIFLRSTGPILDDVATLLADTGDKSMDDIELFKLRHGLLKQYPQLLAMRMATMRAFEDSLGEIILQRLAKDDPALAASPDALASRSRLVTLVAFAAMRHAWICWVNGDPAERLTDRLRESFDELSGLFASVPA
ncbi:MAG: TetR family transcriptional regulator [Salinibacterium sp.]|nr:TetR family transcriptional regulator [Salinibacterium sp.]